MKKIEQIILKNLLRNEQYARKVIPYLKSEYIQDRSEKLVFQEIQDYILKFNRLPTTEAIQISLENRDNVFEDDFKEACNLIKELEQDTTESANDWLVEITEKWCQEKALHGAILESINILDDKNGQKNTKGKGAIPKILSDALGVSFDPNVGHDYIEDSEERFDFYHKNEKKIPFDLDYFNRITKGGLSEKTLTIILAGTNVGKSLIMCHFAAACLSQGYNVLYITMEMAEEKIASRIDANLLDVTLDDLMSMPKENYEKKIKRLKEKTKSKIIIKEYPTAQPSVTTFRNLLNELSLKKQFRPDIIFVDYLNICSSARIKYGSNVNSYTYIKSIAEEIRGLAVEFKVPIVSATQTTRTGYSSTDPGLEDTSESFGLPATADLMLAAVTSEQLEKVGQLMIKQLKNRDNDVTKHKRFVVGIDRSKMRLFDVDESQQNLINDGSATSPEEIYKGVGKDMSKFKRTDFKIE